MDFVLLILRIFSVYGSIENTRNINYILLLCEIMSKEGK